MQTPKQLSLRCPRTLKPWNGGTFFSLDHLQHQKASGLVNIAGDASNHVVLHTKHNTTWRAQPPCCEGSIGGGGLVGLHPHSVLQAGWLTWAPHMRACVMITQHMTAWKVIHIPLNATQASTSIHTGMTIKRRYTIQVHVKIHTCVCENG